MSNNNHQCDDDSFVLIDHTDSTDFELLDDKSLKHYYRTVCQQEVVVTTSEVETVFNLPESNIISTLAHTRHSPYGKYRMVITPQLNSIKNFWITDDLAKATIYLIQQHTSLTINNQVQIKKQSLNASSSWISDTIIVPALALSDHTSTDQDLFQVKLILAPNSQNLMLSRLRYDVKLVAEYSVASHTILSLPAYCDSRLSAVLHVNTVGVYCVAISNKQDSGLLDAAGEPMLSGILAHVKPAKTTIETVIKCDAYSTSEVFTHELHTGLFPVYLYHLEQKHTMDIVCSFQPSKRTGRNPKNFQLYLLKIADSAETIVECHRLASIANALTTSIAKKNGDDIESHLPFLQHEMACESIASSFLQADLPYVLKECKNILRRRDELVEIVNALETYCNKTNYEDTCEERIKNIHEQLSSFDMSFTQITESRNLLFQISQRLSLCKQLKHRLHYVQNKLMSANQTLDTLTIGVIEREKRLIHDLYSSLDRAFNGQFSSSTVVDNDVRLLQSYMEKIDQRQQQLIETARKLKERLQTNNQVKASQPETKPLLVVLQKEMPSESVSTDSCDIKNEPQPANQSLNDIPTPIEEFKKNEEDTKENHDVSTPESNNEVISSESTIPVTDSTTVDETAIEDASVRSVTPDIDSHSSGSSGSGKNLKKKKKKKRVVSSIEDKVQTENSESPDRILQKQHSPSSKDMPVIAADNEPKQHPLLNLDPGRVLYHIHQIVKLLLRKASEHQQKENADRLVVPCTDEEVAILVDNFIFLVVKYVLLDNRVRQRGLFLQRKEENSCVPVIPMLKSLSDQTAAFVEQFELNEQQTQQNEALRCDAFIRWSLSSHCFSTIMRCLIKSPKTLKLYSKNSLLITQDFRDEFDGILDLIAQLEFRI